MLASQRPLFRLDEDVTYLDSAALSPLAMTVEHVAARAATAKAMPWLRDRAQSAANTERLRALAADLIGASAHDMAIVCSVSYGLAIASANIRTRSGERVLILEGDHTSQTLTWTRHARQHGALLEVVQRPADADWTSAILAQIRRPGAARISLASLSASFWLDGSRIDLALLCAELKAQGAHVVIDATQSVGVLPLDVRDLKADFVAFPTYKWLLGPFSLAFVYIAPHLQKGEPIEQNGFNREAADPVAAVGTLPRPYLDGARRFDMGERDSFVGVPTALASLDLLSQWDRAEVAARLETLTDRLADRLSAEGIACVPKARRVPHVLGARPPCEGIADACRKKNIFFTQRFGTLRISPHVFNTEADMDRCADAIVSHQHAVRAGARVA